MTADKEMKGERRHGMAIGALNLYNAAARSACAVRWGRYLEANMRGTRIREATPFLQSEIE